METCFKLFPADFLKSIEFEENQFGIEPELTAKASDAGLSIVDVPISYQQRNFNEGKKIRPRMCASFVCYCEIRFKKPCMTICSYPARKLDEILRVC